MWGKNYEQENIFIGRFSFDEDLLEAINKFCLEKNIKTGWVSVIGAVRNIQMGYYIQEKKEYISFEDIDFNVEDSYEIVSCTGNISTKDEKPFAHMHITVASRDGRAFGGHLLPGTKIFAGEFFIQALRGEELVRIKDDQTGLPLWQE